MISNLRARDATTVLASGPKFDLGKLLTATEGFIRAFVAEVTAAETAVGATLVFDHDARRGFPLDKDAYRRVRRFCEAAANVHDVNTCCLAFACGPFRLCFYPFGGNALMQPTVAWRTIFDAPGAQLDPTPYLHVIPSGSQDLFFQEAEARVLAGLLARHAPSGTEFLGIHVDAGDALPGLRFPHEAFGNGFGTLRIALVDAPRLP